MNLRTTGARRLVATSAVMALLAIAMAGCTTTAPSGGAAGGSATGSSTAGAGASAAPSSAASPVAGSLGSGADTAMGYYRIAYKAAKAAAPDAVFFVVQVPTVATTTPSPSWDYLFGSKKTNRVYLVTVTKAKAAKPQDLGASSLAAAQWATIPSVTAWKIDSDVALAKASATYKQRTGKAVPAKYAMGMA
jgi:hypothetical protein